MTTKLTRDKKGFTAADRAAIYLIALMGDLDKRTRHYARAKDALALVNMIRLEDVEGEDA